MAITSQPFVRFTSFNFWVAALDVLYNRGLVADRFGRQSALSENTVGVSFASRCYKIPVISLVYLFYLIYLIWLV